MMHPKACEPEHNYMGGGGGVGQWWSSIFGASATPGGCEHNQMGLYSMPDTLYSATGAFATPGGCEHN